MPLGFLPKPTFALPNPAAAAAAAAARIVRLNAMKHSRHSMMNRHTTKIRGATTTDSVGMPGMALASRQSSTAQGVNVQHGKGRVRLVSKGSRTASDL